MKCSSYFFIGVVIFISFIFSITCTAELNIHNNIKGTTELSSVVQFNPFFKMSQQDPQELPAAPQLNEFDERLY